METRIPSNLFLRAKQFKSYYVVWKHETGRDIIRDKSRFKSYYVVWKPRPSVISFAFVRRLNRTMQYGNFFFQKVHFLRRPGLNRTMQYGNQTSKVPCLFPLLSFKSYYVVWKHEGICERKSHNSRLNRTMQYGNKSVETSTQVGSEV